MQILSPLFCCLKVCLGLLSMGRFSEVTHCHQPFFVEAEMACLHLINRKIILCLAARIYFHTIEYMFILLDQCLEGDWRTETDSGVRHSGSGGGVASRQTLCRGRHMRHLSSLSYTGCCQCNWFHYLLGQKPKLLHNC